MKIERLHMRGVRSFADPVEVDFARLGEQGLFAIVGPTGAGKSTILDGVFLALFGRSPRGEASECVAAGSNELVVRLEISTTLAGAAAVLAIERAWRWSRKRGSDELDVRGAARHAPLRIERRVDADTWEPVDLGGDKPEAFVKREIVRVSMADFEQAVVLPQGTFGALLGARPTERRALVASLFRTEHLGQPLADVLKRREAEVKAESERLAEAEREVAVDEGEVAESVVAAARAAAALRELTEAMERGERFAADVRRARERCAARDAAAAALDELGGVAAKLDEGRARVALARRAALASDALEALDAAEPDQRDAEAAEIVARRAASEAGATLRAANRDHAAARAARLSALPELRDRLERARAARDRERGVERLLADAAELRRAATDGEAATRAAARAHEAAQAEHAQRATAAAELAAELERTRVGERERGVVLAAVALAELEGAKARVGRVIVHEIEVVEEDAKRTAAALDAAAAATQTAAESAEAARAELVERTAEAAREIDEVESARRALEDAQRRGAAASIASDLRDGSPCPVCGALEHPGRDHAAGASLVGGAERALEAVRRFADRAERARVDAEATAQERGERLRAAVAREGDLEAAASVAEERRARVIAACARDAGSPVGTAALDRPRAVVEAETNSARAAARVELLIAALDVDARAEAERLGASLEGAEKLAADLAARSRAADGLLVRLRSAEARRAESAARAEVLEGARRAAEGQLGQLGADAAAAERVAAAGARDLAELRLSIEPAGQRDLFDTAPRPASVAEWIEVLERDAAAIVAAEAAAESALDDARVEDARCSQEAREATGRRVEATRLLTRTRAVAAAALARSGFATAEALREARMEAGALDDLEASIAKAAAELARRTAVLDARRRDVGVEIDAAEAAIVEQALLDARRDVASASVAATTASARASELTRRRARGEELRAKIAALAPRAERLARLRHVVAGGLLSELAAERHLEVVLRAAEVILRSVSNDRYGIVRRADGAFGVQDAAHAGLVRPPSTLSGGETFLVSLALALALSERIQVAGRTRFDFFFLDEGFGALDAATLDLALGALERLRDAGRVIGMISHVPAVEERMPRRLRVIPSRPRGHARVEHELP